jgi:hypothetical protein
MSDSEQNSQLPAESEKENGRESSQPFLGTTTKILSYRITALKSED